MRIPEPRRLGPIPPLAAGTGRDAGLWYREMLVQLPAILDETEQ
jgi:hypothetical protein